MSKKTENKDGLTLLKPAKGLKVLNMLGQQIPESGQKVKINTFYSRLIKSGDLTIAKG